MRCTFGFLFFLVAVACSAPKPVPTRPQPKPAPSETVVDIDGDGLPDSKDACPDYAGPAKHNGCPWCDSMVDWVTCSYDGKPDVHCPKGTAEDPDADGLTGDKDKCPSVPEDHDGFEDDDGCPEIDNDQDCVFDEQDKCPLAPGQLANHGCPAPR